MFCRRAFWYSQAPSLLGRQGKDKVSEFQILCTVQIGIASTLRVVIVTVAGRMRGIAVCVACMKDQTFGVDEHCATQECADTVFCRRW